MFSTSYYIQTTEIVWDWWSTSNVKKNFLSWLHEPHSAWPRMNMVRIDFWFVKSEAQTFEVGTCFLSVMQVTHTIFMQNKWQKTTHPIWFCSCINLISFINQTCQVPKMEVLKVLSAALALGFLFWLHQGEPLLLDKNHIRNRNPRSMVTKKHATLAWVWGS